MNQSIIKKRYETKKYIPMNKQRLAVISKKNQRYKNNNNDLLGELITSGMYDGLERWIQSNCDFFGGNLLSLRKKNGFVHFQYDFDKSHRSFYSIHNITLLKMLSSIYAIMQQSPNAINICYYDNEFCFESNNVPNYFELSLVKTVNGYIVSNEYETLLSKLLSTLSSQVIKNLKKKITSHGLPCIDQKEFFVTIKDNYVVLSYKCKKLVQFSYELKCDIFFKMLDDWQQILEDKPGKIDVFYDGKTVWFEMK